MLCELTIEQVAVIEKATVHFEKGFNVLTGETGAGKSILIDSINAILGNRTSKDLVRAGAPKASIWAVFEGLPAQTVQKLLDAGYTPEEQLLLQREISAEGKSVCRINGKPAPASFLREICSSLINIHGQHDNQTLLDASKHLFLLDLYAKDQALLEQYQKEFRKLVALEKQIKAISIDDDEKDRRLELLRYQTDEIEQALLKEGEEEALLERRAALRHSRRIAEVLTQAYAAISGEEDKPGITDLFSAYAAALEEVRPYAASLAEISNKWNELYYSAQEFGLELKEQLDAFEEDPEELSEIEERLDLLYRLKQKYGPDIAAVMAFGEKAREELEQIEFSDEKLDVLLEERDVLYTRVKGLAAELTQKRAEAFKRLSKQLKTSLSFLNMPGIDFSLFCKTGSLALQGQDTVEFLIATNPGEAPKPLAKIASGGELSRIMLAFKNVLADADAIDTVIYDEIDTGVSGMAAGRIGEMLHNTSNGRQVICVTHTAQIAARADRHLLIQKEVRNGRTYTEIHPLSTEQRAQELARIISGDHITELSLASAREMLSLSKA